jgi:hypothetical protein
MTGNTIRLLLLLLLFFPESLFSQGYRVSVVKLKNGSAFIEAQSVHEPNDLENSILGDFKSPANVKSVSWLGAVWVGPQTLLTFQSGVKKAIEWATKNEEYKKEFTKEIVRFRTMDKDTYSFYQRYIAEFSDEGKLIFSGYSYGTFEVEFSTSEFNIKLSSVESLQSLLSILQGKSANKEIDDIFN